MKIKKTAHGQSIIKDILQEGLSIECMINQLIKKSWNINKLTKQARLTYDDCRIDRIIDRLKVCTEKEIIKLLKCNILSLYDTQVGKRYASIYLIAYLNINGLQQNLYDSVKEKCQREKVKYRPNQIKKIIRNAIEDGKYLEILNSDGTVKDIPFMLNWGYYNEDNLLNEVILAKKNNMDKISDIEWFENLYCERHIFMQDIFLKNKLNFENPNIIHKKIKKDGKIRKVYSVNNTCNENIAIGYLKKKLDNEFSIQYANRNSIMRELFSLIHDIDNLTSYTIVRFDIKDFFDSVKTKFIWDKYLNNSALDYECKKVIKNYVDKNECCYAGIALSNAFIELGGQQFDRCVRANMRQNGLIFYSRYVDDGLLIFNRYLEEDEIISRIEEYAKRYFGDNICLHETKRNYVIKKMNNCSFDYLGYLFKRINGNFQYGITVEKRDKYKKMVEEIVDDYISNKNIELLRQRLNYFISRIVFYNKYKSGPQLGSWDVTGISANYSLLKEDIIKNNIENDTKMFLKDIVYQTLQRKTRGQKLYFINAKTKQNYSIWNSIEKSKSIVFHSKIGWSGEYLCRQIRKIGYKGGLRKKTYRECVAIYYSLINLQG